MLQQILDNIEGILVELMDNQIDFDFEIRDEREKFLRFDVRFFPEFIRDGGSSRYFPYLDFYGRDGKLKPYIKEALLTLDAYLKNKLMYVKVHSLFGNEGIMMSIPEFTRIEGSMATSIKMFTIGVSVNHLARGKANRDVKEKRINSYSQFINEAFDKNSIKDFCERYLAYLLDNEDFSISLTVPRRGGTSFWTNSEGPKIRIYNNRELVRWNNIKDHIIPFLTILNKEYNCFPNVDFSIANNRVGTNSVIVTHRIKDLIEDTQITNRGFNLITISLRSNQNKFRAKRFLTEELRDINTNISGGRFKEIDKIYNDDDAHVKSRASGILLKDKLRKEEMDSILTALENGAKPSDFNTDNDPKLLRILVLMNNLKFLKDTLQDKGKLQCEYCGKGPLIIYDVVASKFKNLIDNPHYKLNQNFDPEWGATCDHKDPQSLGGDKFDYSNLAVCCYRCNQRKRSMPYKQWMERIGKTNESLVVPRQPIDQMTDTFIPEVFDKFDIDYCKPEDEEKMGNSRTPYWTFVFEDRDGKGGLLETPYEQFLEICWLDSELYTNVMNELLAVKSMVERRTGYSYELKHNTGWGYGFITILTRDKYGNFLRPE